jgi:hypothetical protein
LSSRDEYRCDTHDDLTTLLLRLSARLSCGFKALLVPIASLVALELFVLQALWRLLMRTALIVTIAISNNGIIACRDFS